MLNLFQGDSAYILRQLSQSGYQPIDALITDPPYASGSTLAAKGQSTAVKYTATKRDCPYPDFDGDAMDQRSWSHMMANILRLAREMSNPGAVCVLFIDWRNLPTLTDALQWAGWIWRGVAVWDKMSSRPQKGRFRQQAEFIVWGSNGSLPVDRPVPVLPGVFSMTNVSTNVRLHQTQKPLQLMREVARFCVPGGHILDPFMGSGSTIEAAKLDGYTATGIEASAVYAQIAADRLGVSINTLWE